MTAPSRYAEVATVEVCETCGSVVFPPARVNHDRWHERIDSLGVDHE